MPNNLKHTHPQKKAPYLRAVCFKSVNWIQILIEIIIKKNPQQ